MKEVVRGLLVVFLLPLVLVGFITFNIIMALKTGYEFGGDFWRAS
jgi:hypothetical protein